MAMPSLKLHHLKTQNQMGPCQRRRRSMLRTRLGSCRRTRRTTFRVELPWMMVLDLTTTEY